MVIHKLETRPIHLGLGASTCVEPTFTGGMDWYMGYGERHSDDGVEGRLVSMHTFDKPWDEWEMHPQGSEVVICTAGTIVLHQEDPDGTARTVTLGPGHYAINDPGVWHTADVETAATAIFITAGIGTQHRAR